MAYNTRRGSDLLQVKPYSYRIPAKLKASEEIGANILVGIATTGFAEKAVEEQGYQMVLVCMEEVKGGTANGDVQATHQLVRDVVIVLEGTGFTDADLGKDAYIVNEKTVSTASLPTDGAGTRDKAGEIVEVISSTKVRVHVA